MDENKNSDRNKKDPISPAKGEKDYIRDILSWMLEHLNEGK